MTGPENYKEAERLVDGLQELLDEVKDPKPKHFAAVAATAALAQVHATLALAAAVAGLDAHEGPAGAATGGVALVAHFEIRDGRPECVGFHVESKPKGRGIRTADLGIFNIDGLVDAAFSTFAVGAGGTPLTGPRPPEQVASASREVHRARKGRPRATTRAELERVAEIYRQHIDSSPIQAVRQVCGYGSERTAARRVEQARAEGLLPKTTPGKRRA